MMLDLTNPKAIGLLTKWWTLLESGTFRDQVYLPLAIDELGLSPATLLPSGLSTRSHSSFALIPHDWGRLAADVRHALLGGKSI